MSETRRRTARILIRSTPEELGEIRSRATSAGVSVPEYLRRAALSRRIDHHSTMTNKALFELSRIGNNLNQITRMAHFGEVSQEQAKVVLEAVHCAASSLIGKGPLS
jgi:hypothetical protein